MNERPILGRVVVVATLVCIGTLLPGRAVGQDPSQSVSPRGGTRLAISEGSLAVNGHTLAMPAPAGEFIKILGKATRESRLARTILTWDELGLYLYLDHGKEEIVEIDVAFEKEDLPFAPGKPFAGRLVIEGAEVTADSSPEQLGTAFKAIKGLTIMSHRDQKDRLVSISIGPGRGADETASAPTAGAAGTRSAAKPPRDAEGDPLALLAGDWAMDGFVIGGGGAGFRGDKCGKVTVAPPRDGAVSISASCEDAGPYSLRLARGGYARAFTLTVKSKVGISVVDMPLAYSDGQGWQGAGDQRVGGEMMATTASVEPIEGRNWQGWTILVLPTAAKALSPEDWKQPYFKVDLTRRK